MKKTVSLVIGVLALVLVGWLVQRLRSGRAFVSPVETQTADSAEKPPPLAPSSTGGVQPTIRKPNELDPGALGNATRVNEHYKSLNGAVEFHGLVVDQSNRPVSGAAVQMTITAYKGGLLKWLADPPTGKKEYSPEQQNKLVLSTDPGGRFEVKGRTGHRLDMESVSKPGYAPRVLDDLFQPLGRTNFRYGRERDLDVSYRNPSTPYVFKL